jgi:hypothetical protein
MTQVQATYSMLAQYEKSRYAELVDEIKTRR